MSDDTLRAARRDLLDIMRRMDCQDLFDDAFYALVRYERAALAASTTDEGRCLHCHESASGVCTLHNGSAALAASATDAGPRLDTPEQTHSVEYNRGWADGNASALDACNPVIERLQTELAARPAVPALGGRPMTIANVQRMRTALSDVLRVFDAPFATSPTTRANIRRRAEAALAASATDEPVGPVRIRSANCQAGDHDECLGMVEQDTPGLGITDCLCQCHPFAASATEERKPTHDHPDPEPMGRVGCLACELRLAASATDEGVCLRHRMVGFISAVPGCAACRAAALRSRPAAPVALDVERAEADR